MADKETSSIFKNITNMMVSDSGSFKKAANENNKNIGKIVKDISSVFSSQRSNFDNITQTLNIQNSNLENTSQKIENTNNLLYQSISLQNSMIGELRQIRKAIVETGESGKKKNEEKSDIYSKLLSLAGTALMATPLGRTAGKIFTSIGQLIPKTTAGRFLAGGIAGASSFISNPELFTQMGDENPQAARVNGSASEAMQFFTSSEGGGWTKEQAAGIVGNLQQESGNFSSDVLSGNRKGDNGSAIGVAQWRNERVQRFEKEMGKPLIGAPFKDQLRFVNWELNNSHKEAGNRLRNATSAAEAAAIVDKHYEISRGTEIRQRISNANNLASYRPPEQTSAPQGDASKVGAPPVMGGATPQQTTPQVQAQAVQTTGGATPQAVPSSSSTNLNFGKNVDKNISEGLSKKLADIKSQFGDFEIRSGHRDTGRNEAAGGAKDSAHLRGNAVDVNFSGGIPATLKFIELASKAGIGGIGVYRPGSVHIDTESRRAWGPNHHSESIPDWARPAINAHMSSQWGNYDPNARSSGYGGMQQSGRENLDIENLMRNLGLGGPAMMGGFGGGFGGGIGMPPIPAIPMGGSDVFGGVLSLINRLIESNRPEETATSKIAERVETEKPAAKKTEYVRDNAVKKETEDKMKTEKSVEESRNRTDKNVTEIASSNKSLYTNYNSNSDRFIPFDGDPSNLAFSNYHQIYANA